MRDFRFGKSTFIIMGELIKGSNGLAVWRTASEGKSLESILERKCAWIVFPMQN